MKQKLLVLTSTFPRWENDTEPPFVFELSKQLSKHFDVHVLAPHCKDSLISENLSNIKVTRFRYFLNQFEKLCYEGGMLANLKKQPLLYLLIPFFLISQLLSAFILIKKEDLCLIHAHWIIPQGITACILKLLFKKPLKIICTSHGGDLYSLNGKIARMIKRRVLLSVDGMTVVNSDMKNEIHALCPDIRAFISIIPMGVDVERFTPNPEKQKPFSLLFVGRLVEKKGVAFLIDAMPEIIEKFPYTYLTIIGSGPLKEELEQTVQKNQISDNVVFLGSLPNTELPQYYQQNQIAVFPFVVAKNGDREGMPVVVLEAMSCGCCIISTDIEGLNDVIIHEHNAIIVPQNNTKAITENVLSLFTNPQKIDVLIQNSLSQITTRQSWDVIGRHYADTIGQIISVS